MVALGMRARSATYVVVWHRESIGGVLVPDDRANAEIVLPVAHLRGQKVLPEVLYPRPSGGARMERGAGSSSSWHFPAYRRPVLSALG